MGFGWLFTGYFFAFVMPIYSPLSFAMPVGYLMMLWGLFQLAHYHKRYEICFYFTLLSLPLSVYYALHAFTDFGLLSNLSILSGSFYTVVDWIYFGFAAVFHCLLLYATAGLCDEVGLPALQATAWRNFILMVAYDVVGCVSRLPIPILAENAGYVALPMILLRFLTVFLNLYLLYRAYRLICPEGEEMMPLEDENKKVQKSLHQIDAGGEE